MSEEKIVVTATNYTETKIYEFDYFCPVCKTYKTYQTTNFNEIENVTNTTQCENHVIEVDFSKI